MIYGYIRVSTDKQDCENQKLGIDAKASALGLCIDKYIEETNPNINIQVNDVINLLQAIRKNCVEKFNIKFD